MNTAVVGLTIVGIVGMAWSVSAEREHRDKMPEPGRFFPSR
jgi:ABC-type transport system involved in cytochrome c biogenesis permease subunit